MRRPSPVATILVLTTIALSLPLTLAITASSFAQEPEPPAGEPQPPGEEPTPPGEEPTVTTPTGGIGDETLPRTGWDALLFFGIGAVLLLAGRRLHVVTRIKQVVQRVTRRNKEVALREALEPIRAARLSPPGSDPPDDPLHVEPSTPTARRSVGLHQS